mgnify:CR=1 FL=1
MGSSNKLDLFTVVLSLEGPEVLVAALAGKGFTRLAVAIEAGVYASHVGDLLRGKPKDAAIRGRVVRAMAKLLQVDEAEVERFLGGAVLRCDSGRNRATEVVG